MICIGIVFVLNTFGVVDWAIWVEFFKFLFRFWPLLFVYWGLYIIFSKQFLIRTILAISSNLLVIGVLILSIVLYKNGLDFSRWISTTPLSSIKNGDRITKNLYIRNEFQDVTLVDYNFDFIAGDFSIQTNLEESENLLELDAVFKQGIVEPILSSEIEKESVKVKFSEVFEDSFFNLGREASRYSFVLNSGSKRSNINIDMTAGKIDADFKNILIEELNLNLTAGDAKFSLGEFRSISLNVVAGKLNMSIPKEYRINIISESVISNLRVDGQKIESRQTVINPDGEIEVFLKSNQTAGSIDIKLK